MTDHLSPETLIDYLHHELPPAQDAAAYSHLGACERCSAALESERAVTDALRLGAGAERELPAHLKAAIWQSVRESSPASRWWDAWLRPVVALPVAAVVISALITFPAIRESAGPRIPSAYYLQQHASSRANPLTDRGPQPSTLLDESDADAPPSATLAALIGAAEPQGADDRSSH